MPESASFHTQRNSVKCTLPHASGKSIFFQLSSCNSFLLKKRFPKLLHNEIVLVNNLCKSNCGETVQHIATQCFVIQFSLKIHVKNWKTPESCTCQFPKPQYGHFEMRFTPIEETAFFRSMRETSINMQWATDILPENELAIYFLHDWLFSKGQSLMRFWCQVMTNVSASNGLKFVHMCTIGQKK